MRQAKSQPKSQPHQLDLFKMMFNERFSNSVEFYQSLPDLYSWKLDALRNADGTLPVLTRHGEYKGVPYTLDISPAYLTVAGAAPAVKKKKGFFKTVIAEFVEYALHKLSLSDGFFTEG